MTCSYRVNGIEHPLSTKVLQIFEDSSVDAVFNVDEAEILKALRKAGVIDANNVTTDRYLNDIRILNNFGLKHLGREIVKVTNNNTSGDATYTISVDPITLNAVFDPLGESYPHSAEQTENLDVEYIRVSEVEAENESTEQEETIEDPVVEESDYNDNDVFERRENKNEAVARIKANLELQISRLERLEQTESSKKRLLELEVLKKKLEKVTDDSAKLDDYFDFVNYVIVLSKRATNLLNKIERDYKDNHASMDNTQKAQVLKSLVELKETIDAFYSDTADRSATGLLLDKLSEGNNNQDIRDNLIIKLTAAMADMKDINEKYLDLGIPIHVDFLLEFNPPELNKQIDARIEYIKKEKKLSGFYWRAPGVLKAIKDGKLQGLSRMEVLLQLNIQQLEEKKIGRKSLINELRETHKDISKMSAYTDPIIYNTEASIQMFALALKQKMMEASDATIDFKYELEQEYKKFRSASVYTETDPEKLYENMFEVVTYYIQSKDTLELTPIEILCYTNGLDVNKYNKNYASTINKLRKKHGFPTDKSKLNDYFKSAKGKQYAKELDSWIKENTDKIEGAEEEVRKMQRGLDYFWKEIVKANNEGREEDVIGLQIQFNGLQEELNSVYRNGVMRGRLVQPKKSLYTNPKFDKMTAAQKRYHSVLLKASAESQKKLGKNAMRKNSWEEFSYMVPTIRQSAIDKLIDKKLLDAAKEPFANNIFLQETDTDFGEAVKANGEPLKVIPRYFTNDVDAKEVSRNLTNSTIKFADMANRYKAKSEIVGVVSMMRSAVANRKTYTLNSDGNIVIEAASKKAGGNLASTKRGSESNTYLQLDNFIDSFFYGQKQKQEIMNVFGRKVSANKLASSVSTLMALSTLSANFLQSTNQLIIDTSMGNQEAWANQFYSRSDVWWARAILGQHGYLQGIKEGALPQFNKQTKVSKMMELVDAMQTMGGEFGTEADTALKKHMNIGTLFIGQRMSEYITVSTRMLAMARSYKGKLKDKNGKVLLNEDGNEADLWDMLIEDSRGKLKLDPRVANLTIDQFSRVLHGVSRRNNQLKGNFDNTALERRWYGQLITLFRRFMVPGFRKRMGHTNTAIHTDLELGQITEGYYNTTIIGLINVVSLIKNGEYNRAMKAVIAKDAPDFVKQNAARSFYEMLYVAVAGVVGAILHGMADDDDEEESIALNFIAYQVLRARTEMAAFNIFHANEFLRIVENPTAANNFVRNIYQLAEASVELGAYMFGLDNFGVVEESDIFYLRRSGRNQKGDLKWTKEFLDVFPVLSGLYKTSDPGEAMKYYQLND